MDVDTWKEFTPDPADKMVIGDFKAALKLRNWLAHGRYWEERFPRDYSPGDVYDICHALLRVVRPE